MTNSAGRTDRLDRLVAACEAALKRLTDKEGSAIDPDTFAELGEVLFWLSALAEASGRSKAELILGLKWARNRIIHGVLIVAPVDWRYGAEPGRLVPGLSVLGVRSGHQWLNRSQIALGPKEHPAPKQEAAYDSMVAGQLVIDVLRQALDLLR